MQNCVRKFVINFIKCRDLNKNFAKYTSQTKDTYYQYKYNYKIEELVNKQIQAEQQAAQEYLNIAVSFLHPSTCLLGAGGFFMKMYKEEIQHMLEFIHYQLLRGGRPLICGIEPPNKIEDLTLLDAFKRGLDLEKRVTKQIEEFIKVAEELKDYHCVDFLTSIFLTEQIKSMHEMSNHVSRLTQINCSQAALYYYDVKLAKMYPYSLVTK